MNAEVDENEGWNMAYDDGYEQALRDVEEWIRGEISKQAWPGLMLAGDIANKLQTGEWRRGERK